MNRLWGERLCGVLILMGQHFKGKCWSCHVWYWNNSLTHSVRADCAAARTAILLAWPSAMQPQTMSRPEPGRPAGWGRSMAGSLAINIYSTSRVAEESTRLEPVQRRAAESLSTHMHKRCGVLLAPFPTPCNYSTGRQTGPCVCCFWPHSFLCQNNAALKAARRLHSSAARITAVAVIS